MRTWLLGVMGVLAASGAAAAPSSKSEMWRTEMSTPPGITLQFLGRGKSANGFFVQGDTARGKAIAFGNAQGKSLYTFDGDTTPGTSLCTGECAAQWAPAVVPPGAKATPLWTVVARADGTKQWAYRGKPLYSCVKETQLGQATCNGTEGKWHTALFSAANTVQRPPGIGIDYVPLAGGETLTNAAGMTLYVLGDKKSKNADSRAFAPLRAAALALPVGEFTVARAADGSKQWAFRGKPLFTYAEEIETGDAEGMRHAGWSPAVVLTHFMPAKTHVFRPVGLADVLVNDEGMTLYKRDVSYFVGTGHALARSVPTIPAMGRALGTKGCEGSCLNEWRPLVAAPDAQPSGFWEIMVRPEGIRQWVYQGYPIFTYTKDTKAGDIRGDQIYDPQINDGTKPILPELVPTMNVWALYWSYLEPI
jgi:predicted lipoprotein with Yx(FWY)xxD motif